MIVQMMLATMMFVLPKAGVDEEPEVDLSGHWTWEWKGDDGESHQHVLEVKRSEEGYVALERFDDLPPVPVKDLRYADGKIRFTVQRGASRASYMGELSEDDTIQGEVVIMSGSETQRYSWTAKRMEAPVEDSLGNVPGRSS